jgi:hypothetical protein
VTEENPERTPGWTLGGIHRHGMRLEAACKTPGCGHFVVFDLDKLIAGLGADYPLPEGPGMTCERCGSELKFQLAVWHSDHDGTSDEDGTKA